MEKQIWPGKRAYAHAYARHRTRNRGRGGGCGDFRGRGDEMQADVAAARAMRRELSDLPISGRVVVGEGEQDEVPVLYIGEEIGRGGSEVDIAVDPLEGISLCAKSLPGALSVLAIAQRGGLLHAPDIYMEKIAIGPGYEAGLVSLDYKRGPEPQQACGSERRSGPRNHGLRAGPAPEREPDRGNPGGGRGNRAHWRWRYRGRHPHLRAGGHRHRYLYGHRRRAGRRAGGGGASLHRRPDRGPLKRAERRAGQTCRGSWDQRPHTQILHRGHGIRRHHLRGDRRHRRLAVERREIFRRSDRNPYRHHAVRHPHRSAGSTPST